MGSLMQRRRAMMRLGAQAAPVPALIFELAAPTAAANYDTGVKLFETPMSFTILCEATFANRNWSGSQTIFGTGTGNIGMRVGKTAAYYQTNSNTTATASSNYYTALVFNTASDTQPKKHTALYSRASSTAAVTRPFAVRYDHTTRKVAGFSAANYSYPPDSIHWWIGEHDLITSDTIKFNMGSAGSTVNIFKVYDGLLTDAEINEFLQESEA